MLVGMIYKKHNRFDYTAIENIKQDQNDENLRNMKFSWYPHLQLSQENLKSLKHFNLRVFDDLKSIWDS